MISDKVDKPFAYISFGIESPHRPPTILFPADRPSGGGTVWLKEKPFRPPYYGSKPGSSDRPNLGNYEAAFSQQFLDPPKPGGLPSGRHWPVSYLHKEGPPNATSDVPEEDTKKLNESNKYKAIDNMMKNIKSDDKSKDEYTIISTTTKKPEEEIFLVRIPMPDSQNKTDKIIKFDIVDTKNTTIKNREVSDFEELFLITVPKTKNNTEHTTVAIRTPKRDLKIFPVVRRGYVTRTNRSSIRKRRTNDDFLDT